MCGKEATASPVDRRGLLGVVGSAMGIALAGCVGADDGARGTDASPTATGDEHTASDGTDGAGSATGSPASEPLDLREANVTGVAVVPRDDGYRFEVTLVHDDEGEDGYADWWQVETVDGERLGRRELLHAHGNEPFTRSTTVAVPAGVRCVVVRGHDATHGYGGQAMTVDVEAGSTRAVRQGSEPRSTAAADCPAG